MYPYYIRRYIFDYLALNLPNACGHTESRFVHFIIPPENGGLVHPANTEMYCVKCHKTLRAIPEVPVNKVLYGEIIFHLISNNMSTKEELYKSKCRVTHASRINKNKEILKSFLGVREIRMDSLVVIDSPEDFWEKLIAFYNGYGVFLRKVKKITNGYVVPHSRIEEYCLSYKKGK